MHLRQRNGAKFPDLSDLSTLRVQQKPEWLVVGGICICFHLHSQDLRFQFRADKKEIPCVRTLGPLDTVMNSAGWCMSPYPVQLSPRIQIPVSQALVYTVIRFSIEITAQHGSAGPGYSSIGAIGRGVTGIFQIIHNLGGQGTEPFRLMQSLPGGMVFQMGGGNPERPIRRSHDDFQRLTGHVLYRVSGQRLRQRMPEGLQHRQAGQNQITELLTSCIARRWAIQGRAEHGGKPGETFFQDRDLIGPLPPVKVGKKARNFLQTDDIGSAHLIDDIRNPLQVNATIHTQTTLDVPGNYAGHAHLIPARVKDWTNWR